MDDKFTIQQFTMMNEWYHQGMTRDALLHLYQAIEDMNLRLISSNAPSPSNINSHERLTTSIEERTSTPESFNGSDIGTCSAILSINPRSSSTSASNAICNLTTEEEIERLKALGEEKLIREIIGFIKQRNIKQRTVAEMCNISQPYVSRFLNQDGPLSEKLRTTIFMWFIRVRRNPSLLQYCSRSSLEKNTVGGISNGREHGRACQFCFHPIQVDILREVFEKCKYPMNSMKEEIANRCNSELERLKGQTLKETEKVTIRAVHQWFLAKRREQTRLVKQKPVPNDELVERPIDQSDDVYDRERDTNNCELMISENEQESSQTFSSLAVKIEP